MKKEFVSRQQVDLLPQRIRMAEETNATKDLKLYIGDLWKKNNFKPMNILIVGSGGSYPAAIFAKYVIHDEFQTPNVEAVTPQTAIRIITQFDSILNCDWHAKYDLVIGISYSGKTPDIKAVSDLCLRKNYPFALLTGANKEELSEFYDENDVFKIFSYFNSNDCTGKEKGMISMFSTLAPVIILDDNWSVKLISENQEALKEGEKFVSNLDIKAILNSIKKHPIIHVFYEWDTFATAIDIESKFTESGIANIVLHEKKNFSHGRYTSLYNQDFSLVINLTRYGTNFKYEYDKILLAYLSDLCKNKSAHYIEIGTRAFEPSQWNIEAMAKLPYLITSIGEELGIDISKPLKPFPKESIPLYDYKGMF